LTLDESKNNDVTIEQNGFKFIMTPDTSQTIKMYGDLALDYSDSFFGKGFKLKFKGSCC